MTNLNNSTKSRIRSLDFLRGIAILGMLVVNIPWHVGTSMSRIHEVDIFSVTAWILQYLIFDQRFMPIFCMLFGAGLYLLAAGNEKTAKFQKYFLRRMGVLLLLGILHAYLLWPGDILITYAFCGALLLLFVSTSVRWLILFGVLFKGVDLAFGEWPILYTNSLEYLLFSWWVDYGEAPSSASAAYAGSYMDLLAYNTWRNQFIQWTALPNFRIWNATGFMLIGMALFKLEIIQGYKSAAFYRKMINVSLLIGLPLVLYGIAARIGINPTVGPYFGFIHELPLSNITFRTGCAIVAFSVLGALQLLYSCISERFKTAIENVGKMALSNYIFHSILFILTIHTFRLFEFDTLDHDIMYILAILVSAFQIIFSAIWLKYNHQGPIEAIWRHMVGQKPR